MKEKIRRLAANEEKHYKFKMYTVFNPNLVVGDLSKSYSYAFSRLKLSSHSMPIETGRWNRTERESRICSYCRVLGDEEHYIYNCPTINRLGLTSIPSLDKLSTYQELPILLKALMDKKYL